MCQFETMWSDAHAHLGSPRLQSHLASWIQDCRRRSVDILLQGGIDPADWQAQKKLTAYPEIRCCYGWHPCRLQVAPADLEPAPKETQKSYIDLDAAMDELIRALNDGSGSAIGETGLDFRPAYISSQEVQWDFFQAQVELATQIDLPLVLHVVQAHAETLRALRLWSLPTRPGLVHAFSGVWSLASAYLDLGFHISFGSRALLKRTQMQEVFRKIPRDRILFESDSPDQPIQKGKFSSPLDVIQIAEALSSDFEIEKNQLLELSALNLRRLLTRSDSREQT